MVAESGAVLLDDEARQAIVTELLPLATVITPNLPEARVLARRRSDDIEDLARALHALGPEYVVITGGHRDVITDIFFDGTTIHEIPGERHPDGAAHGSGCTHSSTLAAHLALGYTPLRGRTAGETHRLRGRARRAARDRPGRRSRQCVGRGRNSADGPSYWRDGPVWPLQRT